MNSDWHGTHEKDSVDELVTSAVVGELLQVVPRQGTLWDNDRLAVIDQLIFANGECHAGQESRSKRR
jgi:hypothetical protein